MIMMMISNVKMVWCATNVKEAKTQLYQDVAVTLLNWTFVCTLTTFEADVLCCVAKFELYGPHETRTGGSCSLEFYIVILLCGMCLRRRRKCKVAIML